MKKSRGIFFLAFLLAVSGCASGGSDPFGRGVEHYAGGRINDSMDAYRQAMLLDPADPRPRFNLAVLYQDRGRFEEAEALYRSILAKHPEYAHAWANLASIEEKRNQPHAAEKFYRRAVDADKDDAWTASQYGYFLLRAGKDEEAAALFEESLKRNPRCANGWFGLGEIAERKGDPKAALADYDKALVYNPSDLQAYLRSAAIRIDRGERGAAIGLLRKAVALEPENGEIQLRLGRLLGEEGKWKEAEKAVEGARENGAPRAECERELCLIYGKLAEEAAAQADGGAGAHTASP